MFGKDDSGRNGKVIGILAGVIAGGLAILSVIPVLKRRALRATTILSKDHRIVSGLFWALQQTTNPPIRKSIFDQIRTELDVHARVEEEIFYPAVRNIYTPVAEQQVDEAERDHQRIEDLLHEVSLVDPHSFLFMSKVNELKEVVEHHVDEEEKEMFPLAQDKLSTEELDYIGRQIHERKVQLKERIAA